MVVALLIIVVAVILVVVIAVVVATVVIVAVVVTVVVAAVVIEKKFVSINHEWCCSQTQGSTRKYVKGLATTTEITMILTFSSCSSSIFSD